MLHLPNGLSFGLQAQVIPTKMILLMQARLLKRPSAYNVNIGYLFSSCFLCRRVKFLLDLGLSMIKYKEYR